MTAVTTRVRAGFAIATAIAAVLFGWAARVERVAGAVGAPSLTFELRLSGEALAHGDHLEQVWRARLARYELDLRPRRQEIEVIGAELADEGDVAHALTASGRFDMRMVVDGSDVMQQWYAAVDHARGEPWVGLAKAYADQWTAEQRPDQPMYDWYVTAPSRAELERVVTELERRAPLTDGNEILFERVEPEPRAKDPTPYYRTYLVSPEVVLAGGDIAGADAEYDPNTNRPEVMIKFTAGGKRRFGEVTAREVGHKLAMVYDGEVISAPIIQTAIRGGASTVTMGGSDPAKQERDARDIVNALRGGAELPRGITARLIDHHGAEPAIPWAIRLGLGLALGALVWVGGPRLGRRGWFLRTDEAAAGPARHGGRVALGAAVTFGLPALLWYAARHVMLPGVNDVELGNLVSAGSGRDGLSHFGILALGATPVTSAFILVELVALIAPSWRAARLGTPADRRALDRGVAIAAMMLALIQGWFVGTFLRTTSGRGAELMISTGTRAGALIAVTLAAGTAVYVVAAKLIDRFGLCNGWLALLAGRAIGDVVHVVTSTPARAADDLRPAAVALGAAGAVLAIAASRVRTADDRRRLPWAGIAPAMVVPMLLWAYGMVGLQWPQVAARFEQLRPGWPWFDLIVALPLTGLVAWAGRRASAAGAAVTVAVVAAAVLLPIAAPAWVRAHAGQSVVDGAIVGLAVIELLAGARARDRLTDPVAVLVVHDVDRADRAGDALREAGIAHVLCGVRARAMLRMFGAWVPVSVVVARDDAPAASRCLDPASG